MHKRVKQNFTPTTFIFLFCICAKNVKKGQKCVWIFSSFAQVIAECDPIIVDEDKRWCLFSNQKTSEEESGVWENVEVIILIGSLFTTNPKIHATTVYVHTPHRFYYIYVNAICLYNCSIFTVCLSLLVIISFLLRQAALQTYFCFQNTCEGLEV